MCITAYIYILLFECIENKTENEDRKLAKEASTNKEQMYTYILMVYIYIYTYTWQRAKNHEP